MRRTTILIKGGKIVDPASSKETEADLLIEEGKIKSIGKGISSKGAEVVDAKGKFVLPGLIDMHVHLRDPGRGDDETIASGTRAAALGGFTSVACMPNTDPPIDTPAVVEYVVARTKMEGVVRVFPVGAVTKGRRGEELAEMGRMIDEGAVAFSDDGNPIMDSEVMRRALEYLGMFNVPVISHCEDLSLSKSQDMNESFTSTVLGLGGVPSLAEEIMVARDISLAKEFGRVHIAHVSTKGSVDIIRRAKKEGINVTAETAPHYFSLTEAEVEGYNTAAKVNPPLRGEKDVAAIVEGLRDGTIDVIVTDHAPHTIERKKVEFGLAASGMVGRETALSLVFTELVLTGKLSIMKAIEKMTTAPSRILKLNKGSLKQGTDADVIVFDPKQDYVVDVNKFASKSKNSPFHGWKLKGRILYTIVDGRFAVKDGKLIV